MSDRTLVATPDPDEPAPYTRTSVTMWAQNTWNVTVYTSGQTWTGTSAGQFSIFRTA